MSEAHRSREARGFTFVEVTAALAILAFALVVLIDGARSGTMAFMRTRDIAKAETWARQAMTQARLNDEVPLDGEVEHCDLDVPGLECEIHYDTPPAIQEILQLASQGQDTATKKQPIAYFILKVVLRWDDDGVEQEYELRSARLYQLTEEEQAAP